LEKKHGDLDTIHKFNVKQITIVDITKEKMKNVTSRKDIDKLVNFANSLKFKEVDKETSRKLEQQNLKYNLVIEDRRYTADLIVLNINNNMIFYRGKWYQVNLNAEDYVSDQYKKLNYMEYGTLLNIN
jgi:hypothetical protein